MIPQAIQRAINQSRPRRQATDSFTVPAPVKGINAVDSLFEMGPTDAIYLYNVVPSEFGCRVRKGSVEWANNSGATGLKDVRSLLPYTSSDGTTKLFAVTSDGVYDITTKSTTSPSLVVDYSSVAGFVTTGDAGWCSHDQLTNIGGGSYLLVADEANGYFYYDGTTWTTAPTLSSGLTDPKTVSHVRVWKNRVWLTRESTGAAYYLGLGAVSGSNTIFDFGNKFSHGGSLKGLWNFTRDGGDGIDDFLVAISSGGDLLVYQGYDPANAATFEMKGSWYLGEMPAGKRIASDFGGDLLILSPMGILSLTSLLSGQNTSNPEFYLTYRIGRLLRNIMETDKDSRGWEISIHPRDALLILSTPRKTGADALQYIMHINTRGWGAWRGLDMISMLSWNNEFYFGVPESSSANDSAVWYLSGNIDGVDIAGTGSAGQVAFSGLSAYSNLGISGRRKRCQFIRPVWVAETAPGFHVKALYEFDAAELMEVISAPSSTSADVWDSGKWDSAVWGGGAESSPFEAMVGGIGMGRHMALAWKGVSLSDTTYAGSDVMVDVGGLL